MAHALDLMVPEAIRKKLEPMVIAKCVIDRECWTNNKNGDDKRPSVRRLYFSSWKCDAFTTVSHFTRSSAPVYCFFTTL